MKATINSNLGIKNCADCENNIRCEQCFYNKKSIEEVYKEVRKETAKEIIKDIEDRLKSLCKLCGAIEEFHIKYIKHSMAVTYGVEVEE